jgi:hypothetical protein
MQQLVAFGPKQTLACHPSERIYEFTPRIEHVIARAGTNRWPERARRRRSRTERFGVHCAQRARFPRLAKRGEDGECGARAKHEPGEGQVKRRVRNRPSPASLTSFARHPLPVNGERERKVTPPSIPKPARCRWSRNICRVGICRSSTAARGRPWDRPGAPAPCRGRSPT